MIRRRTARLVGGLFLPSVKVLSSASDKVFKEIIVG